MNTFQSLKRVLQKRRFATRVFFRNDDGGWADPQLKLLVENFQEQGIPLAIAVIPAALTAASGTLILSMLGNQKSLLSVHQHGYAHTNHQKNGRSCEFGSDRNLIEQRNDIARGQKKLASVFGQHVEPIFTPPWNRCSTETLEALDSLGFQYYSRISGSTSILAGLPEIPVAMDWLKKRKGVRLGIAEIGEYAGQVFESEGASVGVMLHHELMDHENRLMLNQFIDVLRTSPGVSFHSMLDVARNQQDPG